MSPTTRDRIAVTGLSIWSSLGRSAEAHRDALLTGGAKFSLLEPRRRPPRLGDDFPAYAHTLPQSEFAALRRSSPAVIPAFVKALCLEALEDAKYSSADPLSLGLSLGTTVGAGFAFADYLRHGIGRPNPTAGGALPVTSATLAYDIACELGMTGPVSLVSTACTAGANAIARGADWLELGMCDAVLAVGADVFSDLALVGFTVLKARGPGRCHPFCLPPSGMALGDGGAAFVLERESHSRVRGVAPHAYLLGYALRNEAYHSTAPEPSGKVAVEVCAAALRSARLSPRAIQYVNAHGTGTDANDEMEVDALSRVFGAGPPVDGNPSLPLVSSTKGITGHTLGGSAAVEAAICVLCMSYKFAPGMSVPEAGTTRMSGLPLVFGPALTGVDIRTCMSTSFGFGGMTAALVLGKGERSVGREKAQKT